MKSDRVRLYVSLAVILVFFVSLFALRSIPVSRIWNGYSVVYVEKTVLEETFLSCLEEAGCHDVISLGGQRNPFFSDFISIMPDLYSNYLIERLGYFFDSSKSFQLYYVPSGNDSRVLKAFDLLSERLRSQNISVSFGMDGEERFPFFVPIVSFLVFFVFLFWAQNKLPFFCASIFAPFFSFSQPFYPIASAVVLFMLSCYLSQRVWGRKKAIAVLMKNPYLLILMSGFCVVLVMQAFFLSGWQEFFLGILMIVSSISSLYLLSRFYAFRNSRISFKTVKIFSAHHLPLLYPKTAFHTLLCLAPLIFFLFAFVFSARFSPALEKKITLPVPSVSSDSDLPTIDDFYRWIWNVRSFPYRSLNSQDFFTDVQEGQFVLLPGFEEKDGKIIQTDTTLLKFNSEFRRGIDKEIESLNYGALEKLMLKEGSGVSVVFGVRENARQRLDGYSLILVLLCLFIPVALLSLYAIKSRRVKYFQIEKLWKR